MTKGEPLQHAVFCTTENCDELVRGIRMKNLAWSVLFAINGKRTLFDLARMFRITGERLEEIVRRLEAQGLIEESDISFEEYTVNQGRGAAASEESSLDEFLTNAAGSDSSPVESSAPAVPRPREPIVLPTPQVQVSLPPIPMRTTPIVQKRGLHLKSLIAFIISQAPTRTEGQIAVYRVFLRVPSDLMRRNGIVSLSLVDNASIIEDPELLRSVEAAVLASVKKAIPSEAYC
jgi:hypothetical protein